jgi:two-component system nitrate/nitrite response regulator NarL
MTDILEEAPDGEIVEAPVKPGAIRIILADSQAIYRVGIRKIFALEDDLRVVAQADSIENLRAASRALSHGHCTCWREALLAGTANVIPEYCFGHRPGCEADCAGCLDR